MVRTDRDNEMFQDTDGPKLRQLEDILRTYLMYNVDLGKGRRGSHDCHVTMMERHVTVM